MPAARYFPLLSALTLLVGCQNYCLFAKRESEQNCPTDVRQMVPWCAGEDAIFHCPCRPNCEFYGYKPTCWGVWPAPGAAWRDAYCGPTQQACPTCELPPDATDAVFPPPEPESFNGVPAGSAAAPAMRGPLDGEVGGPSTAPNGGESLRVEPAEGLPNPDISLPEAPNDPRTSRTNSLKAADPRPLVAIASDKTSLTTSNITRREPAGQKQASREFTIIPSQAPVPRAVVRESLRSRVKNRTRRSTTVAAAPAYKSGVAHAAAAAPVSPASPSDRNVVQSRSPRIVNNAHEMISASPPPPTAARSIPPKQQITVRGGDSRPGFERVMQVAYFALEPTSNAPSSCTAAGRRLACEGSTAALAPLFVEPEKPAAALPAPADQNGAPRSVSSCERPNPGFFVR